MTYVKKTCSTSDRPTPDGCRKQSRIVVKWQLITFSKLCRMTNHDLAALERTPRKGRIINSGGRVWRASEVIDGNSKLKRWQWRKAPEKVGVKSSENWGSHR